MDPKTTFQELTKRSMEQIAKQPPVSLEEMRTQALWLKNNSSAKKKKGNFKSEKE